MRMVQVLVLAQQSASAGGPRRMGAMSGSRAGPGWVTCGVRRGLARRLTGLRLT